MAQAQVDLMKKKYNISHEKREKVKRKLFCDETVPKQEEDEPVQKRSTTPLSYKRQNRIIWFLGAKKPDDKRYYCITCFEDKYYIDTDTETKYLYSGDRHYEVSFQPTLEEFCCACSKKLYKVIWE